MMIKRLAGVVLLLIGMLPSIAAEPQLKAHWIWVGKDSFKDSYNQTIVARRSFSLRDPAAATMRITADTFYRLTINGQWVNDGPCRSYPEHFQYDVLDVGSYLQKGENTIEIIARYFGVGDFHHVPQEPGLLAQLDVTRRDGRIQTIITDNSWEVAPSRAWIQNTPKVSIQMEPAEWFDARLEELKFRRAVVVHPSGQGPWKDLNPRDVALLTRQPFSLRNFIHAKAVQTSGTAFCLPSARLAHPGLIEANHHVSLGCAMASVLILKAPASVKLENEGMKFAINGQRGKDGRFELAAGRHLVLALPGSATSHQKEQVLRFTDPEKPVLENPLDPKHENAWCFLRFPEISFATNDLIWGQFTHENRPVADKIDAYRKLTDELLTTVTNEAAFHARLAENAELLDSDYMFVKDSVPETWRRNVLADAAGNVRNPAALMHETAEVTEVLPPAQGDMELLYDLGEQNCGYYAFDLTADAGVIVDIVGVEFIAPAGQIQWSHGNRNGLRYITKQGNNRFVSLKRRSGRYLFVTLRNFHSPVKIRNLHLVESTYPVNNIGSFACSDPRLDRIWEISRRALKLCMEDTYTDCPLYEQTHWVGDARNEALYGYTVFGAWDIGQRCARQTAQSLERFPFAGCQVPSSWECLLPAWSFLWTISTWDNYWQTGDAAFLREMHPAVIQNIEGAAQFTDERGLFSGPFWNFFDWTRIDQGQKTVLHNSMLLVGAIDAALRSEKALGCTQHEARLTELRAKLVEAVNKLWDPAKGAYPDSIRGDGSLSPSTSQHTSFLSALYDIAPRENLPLVQRNMLAPPDGMVRIGSPFAAQYHYEALEKLGMDGEVIAQIYKNYVPMLEAGATTVWESFPSGTLGRGSFPTRSHCHAWSSAPLYFLSRITLGLRQTEPGWTAATVSPRLGDLTWARGTTATPHGPVRIEWRLVENRLEITAQGPEAVKLRFETNNGLRGKEVVFNGKIQ